MISELIKKHKLSIAFLGDIAIFFLSMLLVLCARYGNEDFVAQLSVHMEPFMIVLVLWLVIFYISNLYTYKAFGNILEIARRVSAALLISFFVTITIFYIFSRFFELTPKANLIMLTVAFGVLDILWRYALRKVFIRKKYGSNILTMAASPLMTEVSGYVASNPQLGYSLYPFNGDASTLMSAIGRYSITQVVIDGKFLGNNAVTKKLYGILSKQIEITTLTDFYETLFGCIPLSEIEEEWFIRELTQNRSIYESAKHILEIAAICLTLPVTIPLSIIIGCLVATTSPGSAIYRQERMGKNDVPFILYKFRTMKVGQDGPLWTTENDSRVTPVGHIPPLHAFRRDAAARERAQGRHLFHRAETRARETGEDLRADPLLRDPPHHQARHHRLGPAELQGQHLHRGGREEVPVRLVLHKEPVLCLGHIHNPEDDQDGLPEDR